MHYVILIASDFKHRHRIHTTTFWLRVPYRHVDRSSKFRRLSLFQINFRSLNDVTKIAYELKMNVVAFGLSSVIPNILTLAARGLWKYGNG